MRVTNKMMADNITAQLFRQTEQMAKTQERIITGKRINRVSDDPAGISSVLSYRKTIAGLEQYNDNIANAKLHIDTVDSVLGMVGELLREAKEIAYDTAPDMRTGGPVGSGGVHGLQRHASSHVSLEGASGAALVATHAAAFASAAGAER